MLLDEKKEIEDEFIHLNQKDDPLPTSLTRKPVPGLHGVQRDLEDVNLMR